MRPPPSLLLPPALLVLLGLLGLPSVRGDALDDLWSQYVQAAESKKYEASSARRERNLDHWDVPTAAAYLGLHPETLKPLPEVAAGSSSTEGAATRGAGGNVAAAATPDLADEYIGHDAAILFYAQWCRNCHAAAPSWDAIATHVNAGSKESNLVMALFDCEKDTKHTELCLAAGIKAYPTMMFVGSGEYHDTDPFTSIIGKDKSAGPFGATTLRRTVKFQGNWQYADQILDWVNMMRGLSSWHAMSESGPLRFLRNGMFNLITGGKAQKYGKGKKGGGSLPVGVPPHFQTELRGPGGVGGGGASAQEVKELETKLNVTKKEKELYEKAVTHSSQLLDGMLFPNDEAAARDPFAILTKSEGWHQNATALPAGAPNDEHPSILRSCTLELSIDYCNRVTTRGTNAYLAELNAIPESDPFPSLEQIEARLVDDVKKTEPYCALVEGCILSNFEKEECRPDKCPFENEAACRYVGSCLDPRVQDEYGVALGLTTEGEKVLEKDFGGLGSGAAGDKKAGAEAADKKKAGVAGWGVPVNQ
ncbi:hypothetical protein ACHAXT_007661 [Thalassiosira profunda]